MYTGIREEARFHKPEISIHGRRDSVEISSDQVKLQTVLQSKKKLKLPSQRTPKRDSEGACISPIITENSQEGHRLVQHAELENELPRHILRLIIPRSAEFSPVILRLATPEPSLCCSRPGAGSYYRSIAFRPNSCGPGRGTRNAFPDASRRGAYPTVRPSGNASCTWWMRFHPNFWRLGSGRNTPVLQSSPG